MEINTEQLSRTGVGNGRNTIVARVRRHDRHAFYAGTIERLQEYSPQLAFTSRNLSYIPGR